MATPLQMRLDRRVTTATDRMVTPVSLNLFLLIWMPLIWLSGADFVLLPLAAMGAAVLFFRKITPDHGFDYLLLAVATALIASLTVAAMSGDVGSDRVIAAGNNIAVLLSGYVFYKLAAADSGASRVTSNATEVLGRMRLVLLGLTAATVIIITYWFTDKHNVIIPSLWGLITPKMSGLLGAYQELSLVQSNWFLGQTLPRTYFFAPFATGSAVVIVLYMNIYLGMRWFERPADPINPQELVLLAATILCATATLARASIGGAVAWLAFAIIVFYARQAGLLLTFLFSGLFALFLISAPELFAFVNEARAGSSDLRFRIYEYSINRVLEDAPLLGFGVKPRLENVLIPIGSHSTPISLLVRGGLLASIPACIALFVVPLFWIQRAVSRALVEQTFSLRLTLFACAYPVYALYLAVQDVDAYPIVALCVFTYLGFLRRASDSGSAIATARC